MSIDKGGPATADHEDDKHKAWETRTAVAHLLGLCEALESVDRSVAAGENAGAGRRPSIKGKEREGAEKLDLKTGSSSHLQALYDHLAYLVTMYRRGLLKASDPPMSLGISQPPTLLQTSGTPNVFRFGRRVAEGIVDRPWLKDAALSRSDAPEVTLAKSVAVHARYLLALTFQDKEPQTAIKHLQAIVGLSPLDSPEAEELARSARRRLSSLQSRVSRGVNVSSSNGKYLDPKTASPRSALGKTPSSLAFSCRISPTTPTVSLSATHADLAPTSSSSTQSPAASLRHRISSAPVSTTTLSTYNPDSEGFVSRMRRTTSTFSNMTANSISSLSPSLFSLRLSDERSEQAPALVDDMIAEGEVVSSSSRRGGGWSWFGRKSLAEGTLRTLANGRTAVSLSTERLPLPRSARPTPGSRPRIPSSFTPVDPPSSVPDSEPPSPSRSTAGPSASSSRYQTGGTTTPSSSAGQGTPTRPTFKTQASDYGDKTLDPQLRQLEMASKVTRMGSCSVCATEGVNLPECPRCRILFCSRACRIGEDAAGDGKKHICGLLEKRREGLV